VVVVEAAEGIEQNLRTGLGVTGLRFSQRHLSWRFGGNGVGHGAAFISGRPPALRFTSKPKRRSGGLRVRTEYVSEPTEGLPVDSWGSPNTQVAEPII
jgi:hypothetical protein